MSVLGTFFYLAANKEPLMRQLSNLLTNFPIGAAAGLFIRGRLFV